MPVATALTNASSSRRRALLQGLLGIACFFLLWYLLVDRLELWRFKQLPKLVPSVREWLSPNPVYGISIFSHEYYVHMWASTRRVLLAFTAASTIGIATGILCGWSRIARAAIFPLLEIVRPIPVLAWIPVVVLVTPGREFAVVTLTFLAAFFITTLNTLLGVKSIDEVYFRAARSLGFSEWAILRHIIVPAALPYVFVGLQIAIAACWFSLVASEIVAGVNGLGYKVWEAYYEVQFETMVVMMATLGLCGYVSSMIVRALGNFLTRWRSNSMRSA